MKLVAGVVALGVVWSLGACGDDDAIVMPLPDSGVDAAVMQRDAGAPPMCGVSTCGSPLVGKHCCTEADRCGVDLGAIVSGLMGECVELRQAGELDGRCPPRRVGSVVEPGCCMAEGVCGTLNRAIDLGCQRVLASSEPRVTCGPSRLDAGDGPDAN